MATKKPLTPDDWGLFTASVGEDEITQEALDAAAAALSAALERAEEAARNGMGAYDAYEKFVEPVGSEFEALGAADSEPRDAAVLYLMTITGEEP
jgi:hypothetical protein